MVHGQATCAQLAAQRAAGANLRFFYPYNKGFSTPTIPRRHAISGGGPSSPRGGSSPRNSMTPGNGRGGWFGEKNQNSARRRGWPLYGADTHRARTPRLHRHAHRRTPRQCRETAHTSPRLVWSWNCPRRSPTRPRRSPTQPRRLPYLPWATGRAPNTSSADHALAECIVRGACIRRTHRLSSSGA